MFGHDCSIYYPKGMMIGHIFTCMCGARYQLMRVFPWQKWKYIGREKP